MKKLMKMLSLTIGAAALVTGCLHALESNEVTRLTTCKNNDLKKIRKNLLLAGYEIKNESDSDLTTDYKQYAGYGGDRNLRRITVVKLDGKDFKFNVRQKSKSIQRNNNQYSNGNNSKKGGTTINIDASQPIEVENDFDQEYYKERIAQYEQTQREVCGS